MTTFYKVRLLVFLVLLSLMRIVHYVCPKMEGELNVTLIINNVQTLRHGTKSKSRGLKVLAATSQQQVKR